MNPITDGPEKEKPAKKKRVEHIPEASELLAASAVTLSDRDIVDILTQPKAPLRQTNVMTREQWLDHLKKIAE